MGLYFSDKYPAQRMIKNLYLGHSYSYLTQEGTLEIEPKKKKLRIGIPRETSFQESRISLTPEAVSVMVNRGHEVIIEHKAGEGSYHFDNDYSEAGATIAYDKSDVYKCYAIVKSAPIAEEEVALLQPNQLVLSPIHLPMLKAGMIEQLINKKIVAIAFESIRDDDGSYPIVRSMSEIAGCSAILNAAKYLNKSHDG